MPATWQWCYFNWWCHNNLTWIQLLLTEAQVSVFRWAGRWAPVNYFCFARRTGFLLVSLTLWVIHYTVMMAKQTSISCWICINGRPKRIFWLVHVSLHIDSVACIYRSKLCIEMVISFGDAGMNQQAPKIKSKVPHSHLSLLCSCVHGFSEKAVSVSKITSIMSIFQFSFQFSLLILCLITTEII